MRLRTKWILVPILLLLVCGLAVIAAKHWAGKALEAQIRSTLGEQSSVGAIDVGLYAVTLNDLRIKAPPGWPAAETLHARRIEIVPDWRAALSRRISLSSIRVEGAYLSIWRAADGRLRLLPSLLDKPAEASGERGGKDGNNGDADSKRDVAISIAHIALADGSVDFYDSTVQRPPHRIRLEQVAATLDDLHLPDLEGRSKLSLNGVLKGPHGDGRFSLDGEIALASKDSDLIATLRGVELATLKPYLIRAADAGVRQGTLDMDLHSVVMNRRLRAPGTITLHQLALTEGGDFLGIPRQVVLAALKDANDDIRVSFVLEGDLNDPGFSLNEDLATRFAAGLAKALGVSLSDLGKSMGGAPAGIGEALKKLFGK